MDPHKATDPRVSAALTDFDRLLAEDRARAGRERHAVAARYDRRKRLVLVDLDDGTLFGFPPARALRLCDAAVADLAEIEVLPGGGGLHWPRVGVAFSIAGLLAGLFGNELWTSELARRAGSVRSEAKAAAARRNGAKGGRPRQSA